MNLETALHKKASIHQVTTMLATFKNVLFQGHNHLMTHFNYHLRASEGDNQSVRSSAPVVMTWKYDI